MSQAKVLIPMLASMRAMRATAQADHSGLNDDHRKASKLHVDAAMRHLTAADAEDDPTTAIVHSEFADFHKEQQQDHDSTLSFRRKMATNAFKPRTIR